MYIEGSWITCGIQVVQLVKALLEIDRALKQQQDQEIQNVMKKISNLVQRVSELPAEIPADPFYEQIKQLNQKLIDAKLAKEKQRPIFTNLVKFIDIHPMKIKIGMYAPAKEQIKATGTDGNPSPESETQNLNEIKEGKLIPFSPNRVDSSTVEIGARSPMLREPLSLDIAYPIQWHESRVNLTELAKLRYIHGWSRQELARHYGRTLNAITNYCQSIRRKNFDLDGLTVEEKEQIKWAYQN